MKLLKLKGSDTVIYINIEKITSIYRNKCWTIVHLGTDAVSVDESIDYILNKIEKL